jgi:hypothetical protein
MRRTHHSLLLVTGLYLVAAAPEPSALAGQAASTAGGQLSPGSLSPATNTAPPSPEALPTAAVTAPPAPTPQAPPANPSEATPSDAAAARSVHNVPKSEADGVLGREVTGADGKEMGRIVDVIVDQGGQPRAAVIDFGGFLGVGNRKIAVDWRSLHFNPTDKTKPVTLDMTPDQIKAAPAYRESGDKPTQVIAPKS